MFVSQSTKVSVISSASASEQVHANELWRATAQCHCWPKSILCKNSAPVLAKEHLVQEFSTSAGQRAPCTRTQHQCWPESILCKNSAPLLAREHLAQMALKERYEDKEMAFCAGKVEANHTIRADCMNCWTPVLSPEPANTTPPGRSTGIGQVWSLLVFLSVLSYLW